MYKNKELKELKQIYEKASILTYDAKIELESEFEQRGMETESLGLKKLIDEDNVEIKNFKYLKNLGFKVETHNSILVLSRTLMAIVMDIIAILLSITCFLVGFLLVAREIVSYFKGEDLGIFITVLGLFLMFMGAQFFSGVRRFIDYLGFSLQIDNCQAVMQKRIELKLEKVIDKVESIEIVEDNGKLKLNLGAIEILDANQDNVLQRLTIRELHDKIKRCC